MKKSKILDLENIIYKDGEYYVAQCLNVDVSSFGKTKKEALLELEDAIRLYFSENLKPSIQKVARLETFTFKVPVIYA